jgi:hypothetical protein
MVSTKVRRNRSTLNKKFIQTGKAKRLKECECLAHNIAEKVSGLLAGNLILLGTDVE